VSPILLPRFWSGFPSVALRFPFGLRICSYRCAEREFEHSRTLPRFIVITRGGASWNSGQMTPRINRSSTAMFRSDSFALIAILSCPYPGPLLPIPVRGPTHCVCDNYEYDPLMFDPVTEN
jgi:hypothetical protein